MDEYKRRVIVSAVIEKKGKYLLTQQGRGNHKGLWAFPGGGLELNEDNLISALKREIKEELGIQIQNEQLIDAQVFLNPQDKFQLVAIFFKCQIGSGEPTLSDEVMDFKWMTQEELKQFPHELIRPPTDWWGKVLERIEYLGDGL